MRRVRALLHKCFRTRRLGVALGGGAARGQAHIGVLGTLDELGIPVHCVAGTSAGAVVGALYCAGFQARDIRGITERFDWRKLVSPAVAGKGFISGDKLETAIDELVGFRPFEKLSIPFMVNAVDVTSGEEIVFSSGPVGRAVHASCCIPGLFVPKEIDGRLLVDGGVVHNVPAQLCRSMGADLVLGVELNADIVKTRPPRNTAEVFLYTMNHLIYNSVQMTKRECDFWIEPDLTGDSYVDMRAIDKRIQRGSAAVLTIADELTAALGLPPPKQS